MKKIRELIRAGALFVVNHSGGKDSQCMYLRLSKIIPLNQIMVVHASLGEVEWPGTIEHIRNTIDDQLPFIICSNPNKGFLDMVRHRKKFPDAQRRQCTSDLKRGPIERTIRQALKERGLSIVVNCMGMRAEESASRKKLATFKFNERNSKAGRKWYDWLPIHKKTTRQVFSRIAKENQSAHWAYSKGMTRLSCCFCIMASEHDLRTAAILNPDLYKVYASLEIELGHTLQMSRKPLTEITGIAI